MSDVIKALVLGIVQGLTEFLPVSSSGHLEIANELMGSQTLESDLTMVVLVHLGTAFSIFYVFRQDILDLLRGISFTTLSEADRFILKIVISMMPALIIGLALEDQIDALFSGSIMWVGVFLLITALILYFTPGPDTTQAKKELTWTDSIVIGISQAIAILPGVSRSGMTIATALYSGVSRESAAKFSFLMVLPVIFGKVLLDIVGGDLSISSVNMWPVVTSLVSSFVVGVWACKWMVSIVKNSKLKHFSYYCAIVGLATILLHFYG
jgi:undecaprenyl-diphosphatase